MGDGARRCLYSFNPVEGFRLRFGGMTTIDLLPKLKIEGYAAYGFKDHRWKYSGAVLYSFQDDFKRTQSIISASRTSTKPVLSAQNLDFVVEDNLFSFPSNGRL